VNQTTLVVFHGFKWRLRLTEKLYF